MKLKSVVVRVLAASGVVLSLAAGAVVWNSRVELTEHGVHKRLLFPLGPVGNAGIRMYAGTGDSPRLPGFLDGPVVRVAADGNWTATWFCEDRVLRQSGKAASLDIECAGKRTTYPLASAAAPAEAEIDMPAKLLLLSDIEGNAAFLDAALRELGVVDTTGTWQFGPNRLVIVGDAVDRGRDVFGVLWRLYALDQQARRHGGAVHLLLGNHEQYLLRGNTSRANTEHLYALTQIGGQQQAFAADTVIGAWLRQQPVVMRAGNVLLAHGGISPQVAASGLSVRQLNDAMDGYWRGAPADAGALDAVLGPAGVTQYRGYLEPGGERYPKASTDEVDAVLRTYGAGAIVVGHTIVEHVSLLHGGRVHAIDVNSNSAASEALLFVNGSPTVVPLQARRSIPTEQGARLTRPIDLLASGDRDMIGRSLRRSVELYRLPHPY